MIIFTQSSITQSIHPSLSLSHTLLSFTSKSNNILYMYVTIRCIEKSITNAPVKHKKNNLLQKGWLLGNSLGNWKEKHEKNANL